MKRSIAAMFWWFTRSGPLKHCCVIPVVCLAGCMATQNRWQATQMRQQVMDYYNDQIHGKLNSNQGEFAICSCRCDEPDPKRCCYSERIRR